MLSTFLIFFSHFSSSNLHNSCSVLHLASSLIIVQARSTGIRAISSCSKREFINGEIFKLLIQAQLSIKNSSNTLHKLAERRLDHYKARNTWNCKLLFKRYENRSSPFLISLGDSCRSFFCENTELKIT